MFSSSVVILALANAATVFAQASAGFDVLTSPPEQSSYKVGDVLPIVWEAGTSTGKVSLELIGGASVNALNPILSIASGVTSQSGGYNWTVAGAVGSFVTYGINLTSDADPNTFEYSFAFHITGGGSSGSSPASIISSSSASSPASTSTSASESTTTVAESTSTVTTSVPSSTATTVSTIIMSSSTKSESGSGSKTTTSSTSSVTGTSASNSTVTKATASGTTTASPTATGAAGMKVVSGLTAVVAGLVFAAAL